MRTPPAFGREDFKQAMARLAPRGRVWRDDRFSIFLRTLGALAPTYERSTRAASDLLADANPTTTHHLLPEWELSLGLPDPCSAFDASTTAREAAVRAKWGARGALTIDYFVGMAARLGFPITITEFEPFCADMPCDRADNDPVWSFAWQVNVAALTTFYFMADASVADDPLETFGGNELFCRIRRDAPAGTIVFFQLSGLWNDHGLLVLGSPGSFPTDPTGLSPGALWSDGLAVSCVPGVTPDPMAPPVYFDQITEATLLAHGGGNFPLTSPPPGSSQLWNNGGWVCIA